MENASLSLCTEWSENEDFPGKERFDFCVVIITAMFLRWNPIPPALITRILKSLTDTVSGCDKIIPNNTTPDYLQCRKDNGMALGYCGIALNETESQMFWNCFDVVKVFQAANPDTVLTKWRFFEVFCEGHDDNHFCLEYFTIRRHVYNIDNTFLDSDVKTYFFAYFLPTFGMITIIFNGFILFILTAQMSLNCNVVLLRTKALFDTLTVVSHLPFILIFISFRNSDEFLPYRVCVLIYLGMVIAPSMFHTVSILVTIAIAFQKYFIVSFPMKVKVYFRLKYIYIYIAVVIVITMATFTPSVIIACNMESIEVESKNHYDKTMTTMTIFLSSDSSEWMKKVDEIGVALRALILQYLPCFFLLIFEILGIRRSKSYIQKSLKLQETRGSSPSKSNLNQVVYMSLANVTIFILAEVPNAVAYVYYATIDFSRNKQSKEEAFELLATILNSITWLSFFSNLIVCMFFCQQFRRACFDLITCSKCNISCKRS